MGLLKKLTVIVMASILSAAMLTACSGGGGAGITLITPKDCKTYTLKIKATDGTSFSKYETTDGKLYYSETTNVRNRKSGKLEDNTNKKRYSITYDQNGDIQKINVHNIRNEDGQTPTITTGTEEYNKKSYKAKIYKTVEEGMEYRDIYLFDNSVLKYYKVTETDGTESYSEVYEVQVFTQTADTDTLNKTKEAVENWLEENE